jgi:hypothetical protein
MLVATRVKAVVVLGAGWSAAAGLPLARQLFDAEPLAASLHAERIYARVQREWRCWQDDHDDAVTEEFVAAMSATPFWPAVVRYIAARLAEPDQVRLVEELRYGERLDRPSPSPLHHQFLNRILAEYDLIGVVTTNYDLLAERTLRHRVMLRPGRPGCFYAGVTGRHLQGASTFSVRHKWVDLSGRVPLCKLHGSLNWVLSPVGLFAFVDCRPAFRSESVSYIVAPMPEKPVPRALEPIWSEARSLLELADEWVVVGYSAPVYDTAIADMLSSASASRSPLVRVVDPYGHITDRYRVLTGGEVRWEGTLEDFCTDRAPS